MVNQAMVGRVTILGVIVGRELIALNVVTANERLVLVLGLMLGFVLIHFILAWLRPVYARLVGELRARSRGTLSVLRDQIPESYDDTRGGFPHILAFLLAPPSGVLAQFEMLLRMGIFMLETAAMMAVAMVMTTIARMLMHPVEGATRARGVDILVAAVVGVVFFAAAVRLDLHRPVAAEASQGGE